MKLTAKQLALLNKGKPKTANNTSLKSSAEASNQPPSGAGPRPAGPKVLVAYSAQRLHTGGVPQLKISPPRTLRAAAAEQAALEADGATGRRGSVHEVVGVLGVMTCSGD